MIIVAEKLSEIALNEPDPNSLDLFGRSAFNRFYYASYLITRNMLEQCNPVWAKTTHKEIPNLLRDCVAKKIKDAIGKQAGKLISHQEGKRMGKNATAAIVPLATLLTSAYEVRCVADYEPGQRIQLAHKSFELIGHSNHAANAWPKRTITYTITILKIWKRLGLS